jgi:hypothetical protein
VLADEQGAVSAAEWLVVCGDCELAGGPYASAREAGFLAGRHDALHHGDRPTAAIQPSGVCESCRQHPATLAWLAQDDPTAGPADSVAFRICVGCAPTTGGGR